MKQNGLKWSVNCWDIMQKWIFTLVYVPVLISQFSHCNIHTVNWAILKKVHFLEQYCFKKTESVRQQARFVLPSFNFPCWGYMVVADCFSSSWPQVHWTNLDCEYMPHVVTQLWIFNTFSVLLPGEECVSGLARCLFQSFERQLACCGVLNNCNVDVR